MTTFLKNYPVATFYVLAFAISWGAILVVVGPEGFLTTTSTSPQFALAGIASVMGPFLAGILMTGLVDGRAGLRDLLARLRRWRVAARWYAVAFLTAPAITLAVNFALSITSPAFVPAIVTTDDKAGVLLLALAVGVTVPIFEEIGWTGFATPKLLGRHGVLATGVAMGLLWGTWHLPLFAGSTAASGDAPPLIYLAVLLFGWLPPYRVLVVWVYDRTHSLLLAMLMHTPIVVAQYVINPSGLSGPQTLASLLAFGTALWAVVGLVALANPGYFTGDRGRAAPTPVSA